MKNHPYLDEPTRSEAEYQRELGLKIAADRESEKHRRITESRLHDAASDLLAALIVVTEALDNYADDGEPGDIAMIKTARAAIAKATAT